MSRRPGLNPNSIVREEAPHISVDDVRRAGGAEKAAVAFGGPDCQRLFVMRKSGIEMLVEVVPKVVRDAHPGRQRLGWSHCSCAGSRYGGHRRVDVDCCGASIDIGCVEQTAPECPKGRDASRGGER